MKLNIRLFEHQTWFSYKFKRYYQESLKYLILITKKILPRNTSNTTSKKWFSLYGWTRPPTRASSLGMAYNNRWNSRTEILLSSLPSRWPHCGEKFPRPTATRLCTDTVSVSPVCFRETVVLVLELFTFQ